MGEERSTVTVSPLVRKESGDVVRSGSSSRWFYTVARASCRGKEEPGKGCRPVADKVSELGGGGCSGCHAMLIISQQHFLFLELGSHIVVDRGAIITTQRGGWNSRSR